MEWFGNINSFQEPWGDTQIPNRGSLTPKGGQLPSIWSRNGLWLYLGHPSGAEHVLSALKRKVSRCVRGMRCFLTNFQGFEGVARTVSFGAGIRSIFKIKRQNYRCLDSLIWLIWTFFGCADVWTQLIGVWVTEKSATKHTLPEANIAPENRPSQKESSIPTINFQVRAVSFRECILYAFWWCLMLFFWMLWNSGEVLKGLSAIWRKLFSSPA